MNGIDKANQELLEEVATLKQRIKALEQSEARLKETRDSLRESDQRFRSLAVMTSDWIWEINADGIYTYASPKIKEILGYEPEEIIGKSPLDMMPKDTAKHIASTFKEISASRRPFSRLENVNIHKDGREIILETNGVPIIDAQGNYLGYRGVDRDITERKQAEITLRKSEEKYRQLAESSHDFIITADLDFKVTYVNKSLLDFFGGFNPVGMSVLDFTPEHTHQLQKERMQLRREGRDDFMEAEWEVIHPDGRVVVFDTHSTLLTEDGKPSGVMYVIRDVTARKRAEEALQEKEERYRLIFEESLEGMFRTTLDGRVVVMVNDALIRMFGYDSRNDVADILKDIGSQIYADPEQRRVLVSRLLKERKIRGSELIVNKKDGTLMRVILNARLVNDKNGVPEFIEGSCIDITVKWLAEEELKASEEKYRKVFEEAIEGIYQTTPDGRYLSVNPSFARMFGYTSPQEMIGSITNIGHQLYVNPEDREEMVRMLLERDKVEGYEVEVYRKDRSRFWISINIHTIRNAEGKILYLEGTNVDISERKRAEEKLRKSERLYTSLIGAIPDVILRTDLDGNITFVNDQALAISGYRQEEIVGRNIFMFISPEDRGRLGENLSFMMEKKLGPQEYRLMMKNGGKIPFEVNGDVLRDVDGTPVGTVHVCRDIAMRKEAEEKLRHSEEKFMNVFMTTPDCIAITRITDGMLLDVNHGFEEITGWKRTESVGKTSTDINFWVDMLDRDLMASDLRAGRDVIHREFQFRHKDGSIHMGVYSARSMMINGEEGLVFVLQDITDRRSMEEERRKLEQQLSQVQKMEAIGTLAGGIAHDFNNIIGAMMGFAELAKFKSTDNNISPYLEHILKACDRSRDLVKQILTFSRQTDREKKPVMLTPLIKEVTKFMRSSLPTTIEISNVLNAASDVIMADATQIHQLIMNLCTNAGHAMKEKGGLLEIALNQTTVNSTNKLLPSLQAGRYLLLTVTDTGHGMDQDKLGRIFEPYFTTKRQGEGTGLGLSVVDGIVKSHGGAIKVYSEIGKGTVFHIYFPLVEKLTEAESDEDNKILVQGSETILFVDDEETLALVGKIYLEDMGYKVITQTDPVKAIAHFRENKESFDIVITDKTMPHMTGFDLAREIRNINGEIPIIICSGFQYKEDAEKMAALEIRHFITKPIKLELIRK